jgi:periplasmic copper chaperone A
MRRAGTCRRGYSAGAEEIPMAKIVLAAAACLLFVGAASAQPGSLQITNVWARATPAKAANGAAYLTMQSGASDRLTGASTPVAANAELHHMTMQGNVMRMRQVASIDLPAGEPVTLKPGGFHIMLLGLKQPLHTGDKFPLTLHFVKAGDRQVEATVEGIASMGPSQPAGGGSAMSMPMHH